MFKYYLTRASDYIISAKILVLLAIYSVFTIGIKIDALRSGLSYWEYILLAMQNMRYIILILCVVFILFLMAMYTKESTIAMIRCGSFFRLCIIKFLSVTVFTLVLLLMHMAVSFILGIGLPLKNVYSETQRNNEVLEICSAIFPTPGEAVGWSFTYLFLGFSFFALIVQGVILFFKKSVAVALMMIIYLMMFFSVQRGIDRVFPYAFLNNYIFLPSALKYQCIWMFLAVGAISSAAILLLIRFKWWWSEQR